MNKTVRLYKAVRLYPNEDIMYLFALIGGSTADYTVCRGE